MDQSQVSPVAPGAPVAASQPAPIPQQYTSQPSIGDPNAPSVQPAPTAAPAPAATPAPQPAQQQQTLTVPEVTTPPATENAENPLTIPETPAYVHEPTGNVAYDMAMEAFAGKGFSPENPAFEKAVAGDFSELEKWAKEAGVDPRYVELAKQAQQSMKADHDQKHGATIKQCLDYAGGQDSWNKVIAWVKAEATPDEIAEIKAELESGSQRRVFNQVKSLVDLHRQHSESQPNTNPADPFVVGAAPGSADGSAVDQATFNRIQGELISKYGFSKLETLPEYQILKQRRAAWRG